MNQFLIAILKYLHLATVLFLLLGALSNQPTLLAAHVLLVPLVMLQWRLNDGTCILTNLENKLQHAEKPKNEQQGQFIKGLLAKVCKELPSDQKIKFWLYAILWTGWSVSFIKLI